MSAFSSSSASTPTGSGDQTTPTNSAPIVGSQKNMPSMNPTADRYAAFSDIFAEATKSDTSTASNCSDAMSMSLSTSSMMGPPLVSSTSLPRPLSKRNQQQASPQLPHQSSVTSMTSMASITRCESVSSLSSDFRMTPISVGSSRGPSPLTIGMSDIIPIAVAFQESVSACFKGADETKCQVQLVGIVKIAFPAGIIQVCKGNFPFE